MKLKNSNLVPTNCNDPFCDDKLDRKGFAAYLENLFKNIEEPFVACLNSDWGTGKSFFLLRLKEHLKNQGFGVIYFNAWENDFSDDALITLFSEIETGISEFTNNPAVQESVKNTKDELIRIAKVGVPKALGALIPLLVKATTGMNIEGIKDIIEGYSEDFTKERIDKYQESKKHLSAFQNKLGDIVKKIREEKKNNYPFIIIIDELDRCRPTFAIEILEKAKHFFSTEGIVFLFGANRIQLEKSVKSLYGQEYDTNTHNGYFRKFFDYELTLPAPPPKKFLEHLLQIYDFETYIERNCNNCCKEFHRGDFEYIIAEMFNAYDYKFSLREQEQIIRSIKILLWSIPKEIITYPPILAILQILYERNKKAYFMFKQNDNFSSIMSELRNHSLNLQNMNIEMILFILISFEINWGDRIIEHARLINQQNREDQFPPYRIDSQKFINVYNNIREKNYLQRIYNQIENQDLYTF